MRITSYLNKYAELISVKNTAKFLDLTVICTTYSVVNSKPTKYVSFQVRQVDVQVSDGDRPELPARGHMCQT